jgi:hypothetical protein
MTIFMMRDMLVPEIFVGFGERKWRAMAARERE